MEIQREDPKKILTLPKSVDPSTMGKLPEQEKVYTPEDLWIHINAVEEELKAELNEIKKVLNKLVMEKLDK